MTSRFRNFLLPFALTIGTLVGSPNDAGADFILTRASGVYQHTNGSIKVILGTKNDAQGLFIIDGPSVSPQEFNLETMPAEGARHVFIKFDATAQPPTYSEIIINDKQYKISGNLTLGIGAKTIVSVDNNNPYLTIVTEGSAPGEAPSIIGFSGINEIVKGTGNLAMILAANQLNPDVAKVIRPYLVENNELMLNGKPVTTPLVGTFIKPESECLKPNSVILLSTEVTKIQGAKNEEERIKLLDQFIKESKKVSRLQDYLVLRTDPKSVILLDIKEKNVREMHAMVPKATKQRICVISDLESK
jgi:hypothetical protein